MQFYYNSKGIWSKNNNFYDITILSGKGFFSSGGIQRTIIRPLTKTSGSENAILKSKTY
ncbi:hypothetical protein [Apibacter adventoris]|uniref:hypothetical protein n=1 Tax=Apibacter adventoris TaxID=1679466 RepID=UPI0015E39C1C|nr:hypothetical protein [Apibacter adventoris]